jgi:hypothetical protein
MFVSEDKHHLDQTNAQLRAEWFARFCTEFGIEHRRWPEAYAEVYSHFAGYETRTPALLRRTKEHLEFDQLPLSV